MYRKVIVKNKAKLIDWLGSDCALLLQHVQAEELITASQYKEVLSMEFSKNIIKLLDVILEKGEDVCLQFLNLLKKDEVNEISPELRKWINTVDTTGTANTTEQSGAHLTKTVWASGGTNVFSPTIAFSQVHSITMNVTDSAFGRFGHQAASEREWERKGDQDHQKFLKAKKNLLVQKVKNIDPILDDLDLHEESIANVRAESTAQNKMRKLLDLMNCESIAKDLVNALWKHEQRLMKELQ